MSQQSTQDTGPANRPVCLTCSNSGVAKSDLEELLGHYHHSDIWYCPYHFFQDVRTNERYTDAYVNSLSRSDPFPYSVRACAHDYEYRLYCVYDLPLTDRRRPRHLRTIEDQLRSRLEAEGERKAGKLARKFVEACCDTWSTSISNKATGTILGSRSLNGSRG